MTDPREAFLLLALEDVRAAARILRPAHDRSAGADGFVSLEVTPDVAHDAEATERQATELWARLDAPNVMIKVPATAAGPPAIEELTARGVNVNVTLLFSLPRYDAAMEAYLRGLERRLAAGEPVDGIASVASFFVSRVDGKVDPALPADSPLRGRVAIANAAAAYDRARQVFAGARWERLAAAGARPQRPLWASTGTRTRPTPMCSTSSRSSGPASSTRCPSRPCGRSPTTARPRPRSRPRRPRPSACSRRPPGHRPRRRRARAGGGGRARLRRLLRLAARRRADQAPNRRARGLTNQGDTMESAALPGTPGTPSRALPLLRGDAGYQAFLMLRIAFAVAPIAFGLDKFFNVMVDWPQYLAPWINDLATAARTSCTWSARSRSWRASSWP